jgi:F420H(2)-dependent quinone reductase
MRRLVVVVAALGLLAAAGVALWRRNPRMGAGRMNELVNPVLVRRGLAGGGRSELGTLEHMGRKSGTVRLTPVHPVLVGDTVRIVVPLGLQSEWARNVLAAGHCRLQLHDTVYELDEPVLLPAGAIADLPAVSRWLGDMLGVMYLRLHRFAEHPGALEAPAEAIAGAEAPVGAPEAEPAAP